MRNWAFLDELWEVIQDRAEHPSTGSYVSSILTHRKGVDKSLEKVGEEAVEFILAARTRCLRERYPKPPISSSTCL